MKVSEYVSLGHPDKIADYISEYILDKFIERDPDTKYAVEVQIKDNFVTLGGEVKSNQIFSKEEIEQFVKDAVNDIGYTKEYQYKWGKENTICGDDLVVTQHIGIQSSEINQGLSGWGDQGIMFGLATNTPETNFMPYDYYLAKDINTKLFKSGLGGLDIKTQVVIENDDKLSKVIVAIPLLNENVKIIEDFVRNEVKGDYTLIVNGTGSYKSHSSIADCGTTGRKLAVDFYGGNCNVGGGCVDGETEYMSESGWKKIKDYNGGKVGQITSELKLEFVNPDRYIKTFHKNVYEIKTEKTTDMVLSDNHNVLYISSRGNLNKKKLSDILYESSQTKYGSHIDIPVTFTYNFNNGKKSKYDDIFSRIIIAHCADGTVLKKGSKQFNCRIRVKKNYKIERLRELFSKSNINYEEREYSDGYKYFYYNLENTSKLLSEQFNSPDYNTAKILSEEVFLWDGSLKEKLFRTKKEEDADFMQFILSAISGDFYSKLKHKTNNCYIIRKVNKKTTSPFRKIGKNSIIKLEPQNMYCFTVPSGMLLLRRNGYIFCTGNSPWTKDGSKADLTLNLYAREKALQYIKKYPQYDFVKSSVACCIGKKEIDVEVISNTNEVLLRTVENISPQILIDKYKLNTPIYKNLCRNGLFSII